MGIIQGVRIITIKVYYTPAYYIADMRLFKSATVIERTISDAGYAVGYGYARKSATAFERMMKY